MRIDKLQAVLDLHRVDAYLVVNPIDIQYLTGYPVSDSWLLVMPKKAKNLIPKKYLKLVFPINMFKVEVL